MRQGPRGPTAPGVTPIIAEGPGISRRTQGGAGKGGQDGGEGFQGSSSLASWEGSVSLSDLPADTALMVDTTCMIVPPNSRAWNWKKRNPSHKHSTGIVYKLDGNKQTKTAELRKKGWGPAQDSHTGSESNRTPLSSPRGLLPIVSNTKLKIKRNPRKGCGQFEGRSTLEGMMGQRQQPGSSCRSPPHRPCLGSSVLPSSPEGWPVISWVLVSLPQLCPAQCHACTCSWRHDEKVQMWLLTFLLITLQWFPSPSRWNPNLHLVGWGPHDLPQPDSHSGLLTLPDRSPAATHAEHDLLASEPAAQPAALCWEWVLHPQLFIHRPRSTSRPLSSKSSRIR